MLLVRGIFKFQTAFVAGLDVKTAFDVAKRSKVSRILVTASSSSFLEAIFSMVRKIYGKQPGDPMEDLNVNLASWGMFMNTTLRAAVHLGKTMTRI